MRLRTRWARTAALASAGALILAACATPDDGGDDAPQTGEDADGDGAEPTQTGFDDCEENPNTCNEGEVEDGGEIVWAVDQTPDAWNSYSIEGGSVYTLQMLHGVYPYTGYWEPDGQTYEHNMDLLSAEPELLDEDPFTYEFYISEDAVWDDGTPITADDFEVSWKMATSPDEGHCEGCTPRSTSGYDEIESVEGSDDGKTVTITLKEGEATAEWFALFGADSIGGGIVPAHIADREGFDIDDPAGLGEYFEWLHANMPDFSGGPYRLVEGDLDNQVVKEPNPEWYGDEVALDTMIVQFVTDADALPAAFQNGEIHGSSPASFDSDVVNQLEQMQGAHLNIGPGPSWSHLDVNLGNEQLEDVELRRAIFTAIDVDEIGDRTYGDVFPDYTLRKNHIFGEESEYFEDLIGPSGQLYNNHQWGLTAQE